MAKEQTPIGRSVLTPVASVNPGNAFERMGDAAGQLSSLITNKTSALANEQAARDALKDVEEGRAPKTLMPPINQATKTYNDAVSKIEAQRMVISAHNQIQEAYLNHTNPATFNAATPAQFHATLKGIIEGTLQHTRDTNREEVRQALDKVASSASLNMLQHSIQHDNQQMINDFKFETQGLLTARKDAAIAGDAERLAGIDAALQRTLDNYSSINQQIKESLPEVKKQIEEDKIIHESLHSFATASTEGRQAQWLADFIDSDTMPFDIKQKAIKEVYSLYSTEKQLKNDIRAQEMQQVNNAIDNGTLNDIDDIADYPNLTLTQQLQAVNKLETRNRKIASEQNKFLDAQNHILRNQSAMISSDTKNQMFEASMKQFEQATGRPMSIVDMEQSILGLNQFPASGMPGTPLGTDVPKFNAQLTAQLTGGDPQQVMQAASVFNDMVNIKGQPNSVNLTGEALSIASSFNELNTGGTDPVALAQRVSDNVLHAKDAEIQIRSDRFHRTYRVNPRNGKSEMSAVFKDMFGVSYQPGINDTAMGVLTDTYRSHYLRTGSEEAAKAATQYELRAWGISKYFQDGMVSQPAPEKELNITQIGHAFDNQLRVNLQALINENQEMRQKGLNIPSIEWLQPDEQSIDISSLTDEQRVFDNLGTNLHRKNLRTVEQAKPKVKIDGRETEVFLMPGPDSRLGDRIQYALFYYDKFGAAQPLPDPKNPSGVSHFSPVGLEQWAPSILESQRAEELKRIAVNIQKAQAKQEWDNLKGLGALGKVLPELETYAKVLRNREQVGDIFSRMVAGDASGIEAILKQKIQRTEAEADNVGIAALNAVKGARDNG